ncbi:calmodulin-like protein [Panaeolus papilionaceus]|nr:calmodulin-like protein [Panaeolus papilionaceus]
MAPQLSQEELQAYRDAFETFDKDKDGTITLTEIGEVMGQLGKRPTDAELKKMIGTVDKDRNGTIDFEEFTELMVKQSSQGDPLRDAFDVFDKDGNGEITLEELTLVMRSLGERLSDSELQQMMAAADLDGNKTISFFEFQKMMKQ